GISMNSLLRSNRKMRVPRTNETRVLEFPKSNRSPAEIGVFAASPATGFGAGVCASCSVIAIPPLNRLKADINRRNSPDELQKNTREVRDLLLVAPSIPSRRRK